MTAEPRMHIMTVVGARPQFIKAAPVSRAIRHAGLDESIVHTGQHYDAGMSQVFFDELGIPEPTVNLGVGSGSHAEQTGAMLVGLERIFSERRPALILVYGDTNSTIASALAAAKLSIPVAHVEAGLRSFNRRMPEETNRIVTDRLSDLLFCPTRTAVDHLRSEGVTKGVHLTGDVMYDATLMFAERAPEVFSAPSAGPSPDDSIRIAREGGTYVLATVHRAENTDDPERLRSIMRALGRLGQPVILPLHPRTRSRLEGVVVPESVRLTEPASYLSMLALIRGADRVLTDSGGLQKEAVWLGTPCITLRNETEWVETLEGGWNRLAGADEGRILAAFEHRPDGAAPDFGRAPDGRTASSIIAEILTPA